MADQDLIRLCRDYVEAFNAGDWQRYRTFLAPGCVYEELATQRRVQGPDQILQVDREWREAFPDAKGTVTKALASGNIVVQEILWEGTQRGPLMGPSGAIPPSGKRARVPAVQVITVQDNKIKEVRHYFDLMGLLQQLGAIPAPPPTERYGEYRASEQP